MDNFFDKYYRLLGILLIFSILAGAGVLIYKSSKSQAPNSGPVSPGVSQGGQIQNANTQPPQLKPQTSKININTASEQELDTLPGIGPAKAKAIADYRKKYGNFKTKRDIIKVKGIGEKTYEKLKDKIEI